MVLSKILPLGFLSVGIFLLTQVVLPVASFELWEIGQNFNQTSLVSPRTQGSGQVLGVSLDKGVSVQNKDNFPAFVSTLVRISKPTFKEFSLTIPKINIDKAKVLVDSNDLSESLAHLPGSALPGERGNVFISGHSSLSILFPLKTVPFAKLLDLKKGDEIVVDTAGSQFRYEVVELKAINPKETWVINPPEPQARYISLMTCVPPGLNFKRLVVLGKML